MSTFPCSNMDKVALREFSKVIQTLDYISGWYNCLEFTENLLVFRGGYLNTEKVLCRSSCILEKYFITA